LSSSDDDDFEGAGFGAGFEAGFLTCLSTSLRRFVVELELELDEDERLDGVTSRTSVCPDLDDCWRDMACNCFRTVVLFPFCTVLDDGADLELALACSALLVLPHLPILERGTWVTLIVP